MKIWIYTPSEHVPCGLLESAKGIRIEHKAVKPGEIQFECPLDEISKQICKKTLLWPVGDDTAYIVTFCHKETQDNGAEIVTVKGKCLKWMLLGARKLPLEKVYEDKSGKAMNRILEDVFTESKRRFPRFSWMIDNALGDDITLEASAGSVLSTFESICDASLLTMKIQFDATARTMRLLVAAGADRSVGNAAGNQPILFDETLGTIVGIEHDESIDDYANVMYIADKDKAVMEIGDTEAAGFDRFEEQMTDSGGKEKTNEDGSTTTLTDAQYRQKKTEAAQKELDKKKVVDTATGEIPMGEMLLTYGQDYLLGDIATVRKGRWGVQVNVRIMEESITEQNGRIVRTLTIGDPLPTIVERIKMR